MEMTIDIQNLSHKQRKALQKKLKRKAQRQEAARLRDEQLQREEERRKQSPGYQARLAQEEYERQAECLQIEAESRRQHELWVWAEERWAEQQKLKKEQEERDRLQKIEIEKKIKEEWEERQKKEQAEEEERKKKKEKQAALLQQARDAEHKDGAWHNPLAPPGKERETCPFFAKVGACRFGERCSRGHPYPESSTVLMFSAMFTHFRLDQGLCEEYDTDIVLEYEDSELYQSFKDFYEDVLPEFKNCGEVVQFKVCCNYQSHLRGNVYIQFAREEDATQAFSKFNARWYGGKQLSCEFVTIPSWRAAICGLFGKGRCPKGKECNFLHVFTNPRNEFWQADKGFPSSTRQQSWRNEHSSDRHHRYRRSRSRSRDRHRDHSRSTARSTYSRNRYSRSRSRDRHYKKKKYRRSKDSQSRSRSKSRRYSRAISSSRSRSRSTERQYKRHYKSRDYAKSRSRSRSRSSSRSRSKSRERYKNTSKRNRSYSRSPISNNVQTNKDNSVEESPIENRNSGSDSRSRSPSYERKSHKKHKKHKHKRSKDKSK